MSNELFSAALRFKGLSPLQKVVLALLGDLADSSGRVNLDEQDLRASAGWVADRCGLLAENVEDALMGLFLGGLIVRAQPSGWRLRTEWLLGGGHGL